MKACRFECVKFAEAITSYLARKVSSESTKKWIVFSILCGFMFNCDRFQF
jgi:hypothetical protein